MTLLFLLILPFRHSLVLYSIFGVPLSPMEQASELTEYDECKAGLSATAGEDLQDDAVEVKAKCSDLLSGDNREDQVRF